MNICINIIVTRKYHVFVQPLFDSICKYFLLRHSIQINLFTDDTEKKYFGDDRVSIEYHQIPSFGFPDATLLRFQIMSAIDYTCDYIYYLDVDSLVVSEVDEEILAPIVAVLHPGFSVVGGGSWCDDPKSIAYTSRDNRKQYFCGGVNGGSKNHYVAIINLLKERIAIDRQNGVKAEHNDESHWNWYLSVNRGFKIMDSSYCMVEEISKRQAWGIGTLKPKIIALAKNHSEIRS